MESALANQGDWAVLNKFLPTASKVFEEMLDEILKWGAEMSDKNFASKVDRLIEEIDSAAVANGEELSWLEISSAVYEKMFNEPAPHF